MLNKLPTINPAEQVNKIISFLHDTVENTGIKSVVLGWSGGLDSTVCLYLLAKAYNPSNIHLIHMPYSISKFAELMEIQEKLRLDRNNIREVYIDDMVDSAWNTLEKGSSPNDRLQKIRKGNIMARMRMVTLFDYAKLNHAIVCGTENRSEHMLGYFTRFGDGASDLEPIRHLFKTNVYELGKHLNIIPSVMQRNPSADLWEGQTDEKEFGFSYMEADQVLYLYFDRHMNEADIERMGYKNTAEILSFSKKNKFKHLTPYLPGM